MLRLGFVSLAKTNADIKQELLTNVYQELDKKLASTVNFNNLFK